MLNNVINKCFMFVCNKFFFFFDFLLLLYLSRPPIRKNFLAKSLCIINRKKIIHTFIYYIVEIYQLHSWLSICKYLYYNVKLNFFDFWLIS